MLRVTLSAVSTIHVNRMRLGMVGKLDYVPDFHWTRFLSVAVLVKAMLATVTDKPN